jgi:hypothetical protein
VKLRDQLGRFVADGDFFVRVMAHVDSASAQRASPKNHPGLKELRRQGFTDEGIDQVLAYGGEHGLTDPIEAMHAYQAAYPPPEPVLTRGGRWDGLVVRPEPDISDDLTALLVSGGNDEQWTSRAVSQTLRRVRRAEQDDSGPLHLLTAGFGR